MIRIDVVWLATAPIDMRAGTETVLARVVAVFGAAHAHHAYVFANRRGNRLIWPCMSTGASVVACKARARDEGARST